VAIWNVSKLLGKRDSTAEAVRYDKPTFGTCAGAILLASEVDNPKQAGLGAIDIGIRRNAYGRQVDSSIREGQFVQEKLSPSPIEMVFIARLRLSAWGRESK